MCGHYCTWLYSVFVSLYALKLISNVHASSVTHDLFVLRWRAVVGQTDFKILCDNCVQIPAMLKLFFIFVFFLGVNWIDFGDETPSKMPFFSDICWWRCRWNVLSGSFLLAPRSAGGSERYQAKWPTYVWTVFGGSFQTLPSEADHQVVWPNTSLSVLFRRVAF